MSKSKKRNARNGYLLTLPLVLGCIVFYAFPIGTILWKSLSNGVGNSLKFVGWNKYVSLLQDKIFLLALKNTMKFLGISIPLVLVLSYLIAIVLKKQVKQHKILKSVIMLPYIMPVVGTVLLVNILFAKQGLLNSANAFWIVILLFLWKNTGYSIILLLSGLATIPDEQYATANIDGANEMQQFYYITMPQMWYSVFFSVVFSMINAFKCFREILLIGGVHPHDSIYMLQHFINNCFENMSYPKLAVASVLLLFILAILFMVVYQWVMKREEYRL